MGNEKIKMANVLSTVKDKEEYKQPYKKQQQIKNRLVKQIKKNFTSDELQEMYGFNRRRLERMMSILVEQFGDKIETVENSTDRKNILDLKKEQLIH